MGAMHLFLGMVLSQTISSGMSTSLALSRSCPKLTEGTRPGISNILAVICIFRRRNKYVHFYADILYSKTPVQ
jgi:hypothetical protein